MKQRRWNRRPSGSNWGDFGPDDELGRLNLLGPATLRTAIDEVRVGTSFCLSLPLDFPGERVLSPNRHPPRLAPEVLADGRPAFNARISVTNPRATDIFCDDRVELSLQYSTHWDGLAHIGQLFDIDGGNEAKEVYYNGFHVDGGDTDTRGKQIATSGYRGARHLGIENMAAACVQGRGVMIDIATHFGRSGTVIGFDELMHIVNTDSIQVEAGDFLCLRTGFAELVLEMNGKPDRATLFESTSALDGRDKRLQDWITGTGLVAIAADNYAVEKLPARDVPELACCASLPLHEHCLFRLGVYLGEMWYFRELASWLREHKRSRFFLSAPPLRLPGAVASPVTPIATV